MSFPYYSACSNYAMVPFAYAPVYAGCAQTTYFDSGVPYASSQAVEVSFPCHSNIVGHLTGRNWSAIEDLISEYKVLFQSEDVSVTHDGCAFRVRLLPLPQCLQFWERELGQRIAVAHEGIEAQPIGAIIGKEGWWLRKTEKEQSVPCMIYNEDGLFFLKFASHVATAERLKALDNVRRKIMGRAAYFVQEFSDMESDTTNTSTDTVGVEHKVPGEPYD